MYNFDVEFTLRSIRRSEEAIKSDSMVRYASTRKTLKSGKALKNACPRKIIK